VIDREAGIERATGKDIRAAATETTCVPLVLLTL